MVKKNIGKTILQYPKLLIWDIHKSMAEDIKLLIEKQLQQMEIQGIVRNIPHLLGTCSFKSPRELMTVFAPDKPICVADMRQIRSREKMNIHSLLSKVGFDENSDETVELSRRFMEDVMMCKRD